MTFVVTFRAVPGSDPVKGLRRLLKHARRYYGLECVEIREASEPPTPANDTIETVRTRDVTVHHRGGAWSTHRAPPPGTGWRLVKDGERYTVWQRRGRP